MDRRTPITSGRRYAWLPALALAAVAVAGCSSSGGGSTSASAPPSSVGTATAPATGTAPGTPNSPAATTPAAPPSATPTPTPTAAIPAATTPAGTTKRPADACTLLTSPQVVAAVGTAGPFRGTHPDKVDGKEVWGCTWGSPQSYVHIRETSPTVLAGLRTNPEYTLTPLPGVGEEAYLVQRKDGFRPEVYFVSSGHLYSVEAVKDRGPNDDANGPAEAAAASGLALALSKLV
ncbi:hypothetical protein OG401_36915 [Kitasatospora purpeofusca]|uniref:hypothetical protein n=1 Tax=Kitasatospora purpeofusca TaxID=67352 RepID=UPI002257B027|nr:hypothetical protein [Kitasatospora purpeofusca]MCX4689808.1 hypothetical protein [Kitasatospora purpeofusca]